MTAVRGKIVGDVAVTIVHHPTPNIKYGDDPNGPPLKRLAPRRPPLNPAPPEEAPPEPKQAYKDE